MDLAQLTDKPELSVTIGGKEYKFSELPIDALGALQAYIKSIVPHPVTAIRDQLGDFPAEYRSSLLDSAVKLAQSWPPKIGTPEGNKVLFSTPDGQIEALFRGLLVHHPGITKEIARTLYQLLVKGNDQAAIESIVRVMFGLAAEANDDGDSLPKGQGAASPLTGP